MLSRAIVVRLSALLLAGGLHATNANGTVTASHQMWSEGALAASGDAYVAYRICVDVTDTAGLGSDDWTSATLEVDLIGGVFYQQVFSDDPPPPIFDPPPDWDFDSYYTSPGDYPNWDYQGDVVFVTRKDDTATRLDTDWHDLIDTGNGSFVVTQATILPDGSDDWFAAGRLTYTAAHTGDEPLVYTFTMGNPAALHGDLDGDHDVDLADLATLLAAYGTCAGDPGYDPDADFDDSGCVDLSDLATLLANYGFGT
jgi:hypothetical protein